MPDKVDFVGNYGINFLFLDENMNCHPLIKANLMRWFTTDSFIEKNLFLNYHYYHTFSVAKQMFLITMETFAVVLIETISLR